MLYRIKFTKSVLTSFEKISKQRGSNEYIITMNNTIVMVGSRLSYAAKGTACTAARELLRGLIREAYKGTIKNQDYKDFQESLVKLYVGYDSSFPIYIKKLN